MDEIGYVFSPLDLKILILFILRRLPGEIETERLMQICQEDGVVNYFDFTICLDELKESGQLTLEDGFCSITPRGRQTAETLDTSLPYSVRMHATTASATSCTCAFSARTRSRPSSSRRNSAATPKKPIRKSSLYSANKEGYETA